MRPSIDRGRLYLGGYNAVEGDINRVFCLDAANGKLIWKSDPIERAIHVVTIGDGKLFTHAQYRQGYLLNPENGAKMCELTQGYRCTRFTMDGSLLIGSNMDLIDTSQDNRLISTGPAVDVLQCVGAHSFQRTIVLHGQRQWPAAVDELRGRGSTDLPQVRGIQPRAPMGTSQTALRCETRPPQQQCNRGTSATREWRPVDIPAKAGNVPFSHECERTSGAVLCPSLEGSQYGLIRLRIGCPGDVVGQRIDLHERWQPVSPFDPARSFPPFPLAPILLDLRRTPARMSCDVGRKTLLSRLSRFIGMPPSLRPLQ